MNDDAVSVIICAYTQRRWDDLSDAVASAIAQPETHEIIVVIDHERELLHRAQLEWDGGIIRVVPNRFRQGLSGARNTGLKAATGSIVAFLDDDAAAHPGWLARMLDCFDSEDVVGVGGRAVPVWPDSAAPACLPSELLWVVGCTYRGQPTTRTDVRNVMGCSMAFRRGALTAIGGFNPDTGRVGRVPRGGEETEACIRLRQADPSIRIVFEPLSVVSHRVTPDRTTWRYLRRRSFFEGVSKAALSKTLGTRDALSSERNYARTVLPTGFLRELTHLRLASAFAIVLCLAATAVGYLYGDLHRRSGHIRALEPVENRVAG